MGGENEAQECFEGEGGDKIMVEIVGSDVFVNGAISEKECSLFSGEMGYLEGDARGSKEEIGGGKLPEGVDVDETGEFEAGFEGPRDYDAIIEEKTMGDEIVKEVSAENLAKSEVLNCPAEASAEGVFDKVEKKGVSADYAHANYTEGEGLSPFSDKAGILGPKDENASSNGDFGVEAGIVDEKVVAAETGDSIVEKDSHVPDVFDQNHGRVKKNCGVECDLKQRSDDVQIAEVSGALNIDIQAGTKVNQPNVEQIGSKVSAPTIKSPETVETLVVNVSKEKTSLPRDCCAFDVATIHDVINNPNEAEENSEKTSGFCATEDHAIKTNRMVVEYDKELEVDHSGENVEAEISEEPELETEIISSNEKSSRLERTNLSCCLFQKEDHFVPSDLVWGKVRSHPWWPGQIFDPAHACEKALKYQKKEDSYLESDLKLPESREEKNHVVAEEAMDVSSEGGEDNKVENDLKLPESRDEKNHVVAEEAMDVSSEGGEDKKVENDLKLPESKDEKNHVVTEAIDASSEGDENRKGESALGLSNSGDEESLVVKEVCSEGYENKEGKSELGNEKGTVLKQAVDCSSAEPENVEAGVSSVPTQEDIATNQLVISENKPVEDETVDDVKHGLSRKDDVSPLSGDASNPDQPVSNSVLSLVASEKTDDSQMVRPDNIVDTNGEGPENVQVDAGNMQTEIVDEKEGLAAGSKDLVVKSDCVNDSHGMKLDNENESEEAASGEDFDVVLDFNDCTRDINPNLSLANDGEYLKSDRGLVSNTDHPDHFVSHEQTQPADEIDTDMENQPKTLEGSDGGELCKNTDEIVSEESKQPLDCEKNGGGMPYSVEQSGLPQSKEHEEVEKSKIPDTSDKIECGDERNESGGDPHDSMDIDSEHTDEELPSKSDNSIPTVRSPKMNQAHYFSPPENEVHHFAVSDLVWGKVRSHPWWPGQIFDPSDASEKAGKHFKKDTYLVAFFGDQTFAWNEASLLKPFRLFFSQIEKQFSSEGFQHAVTCALDEVSRRVELGLACSCIPRDKYAMIETQTVENTGIREESSKRNGLDRSSRVSCFEPDELFEYIKHLAPHASFGADRLDLTIARAQLSSFYSFKGYRPPTVFPSSPGDLLEAEPEKLASDLTIITYQKRKNSPKDSLNSANNQDESSCKKQKALDDPLTEGYDKMVSVYAAKVSTQMSQIPNKPSFKIGECIRRVASQLTGSDEQHQEKRGTEVFSVESFSVEEMITQLELVAREPKRRHDFISVVHTFFMGFRSAVVQNRRARKKRAAEQAVVVGGAAEEYDFDDINDSYWTDRVVQNYSDEQNQHLNNNCGVNGLGSLQKQAKTGRRPRKRFSYSVTADSEREDRAKRAKQESSPAELILNFVQRNNIPSEINLNKMFRRFGPLMESETEVDHESGCAKVIFKRGCDAEVARDSSERFNIFGAGLVNYQIGYEPLISVKVLPLVVPPPPPPMEDVTFMQ
ncbi:Tudor/PWWP/MBT superfamily protein [Striga hermonthica]|uniref:Tudor/PWWP/MBT superfamily protein n=1 Tax=Striga hermonthica TaxID=68872 RepID=A0A9N7MUG1_STRHE|nr:Tudor/PWWP/MBT superfamily protein [Striga hermonthica]